MSSNLSLPTAMRSSSLFSMRSVMSDNACLYVVEPFFTNRNALLESVFNEICYVGQCLGYPGKPKLCVFELGCEHEVRLDVELPEELAAVPGVAALSQEGPEGVLRPGQTLLHLGDLHIKLVRVV